MSLVRCHRQAEPDVRRPGIGRRPAPCARTVALAVGRVAEERAALDHPPLLVRVAGIEAAGRAGRIVTDAVARALGEGVGTVPVGGPLPHVAGHIVEPSALIASNGRLPDRWG